MAYRQITHFGRGKDYLIPILQIICPKSVNIKYLNKKIGGSLMARIAGVDLPREKRVEIGLTYIYGIGRHTSNKI